MAIPGKSPCSIDFNRLTGTDDQIISLLEIQPRLGKKSSYSYLLGVGFKYFLFSSLFGEMIQVDEHIFQMGGSTTN